MKVCKINESETKILILMLKASRMLKHLMMKLMYQTLGKSSMKQQKQLFDNDLDMASK